MSAHDTEQLDRLEPAYLANYGLNISPFSSLHDDAFLYLDAERAQRLNLLEHLTQSKNLLLIVQGECGVGKTSLLMRFINNAATNWKICEVSANALMDADLLMFQIAQGFGLQQLPRDSGELQEMLYAQIAKLHHQAEIPILVIDDAHELAKDALLAIFNLADTQVDDANLLRIILFAEPQIEKILDSREIHALRERITHTMAIPPLDEVTTAEYLKHRMAVAGFDGGSPFTPKMVKRIFRASGGNPEKINQLAHEALDKGDFASEEVEDSVSTNPSSPQRKKPLWIGIGIVVVALVLLLLLRITHQSEDTSTKTTTLPIPLAEKTPVPASQPTTAAVTTPEPSLSRSSATQTPMTSAQQADAASPLQKKIIPLQPQPTAATQQATGNLVNLGKEPGAVSAEQTAEAVAPPAQQPVEPASIPLKLQGVTPDPLPASNAQQAMVLHGEGFTRQTQVFVSWADRDREIPSARVRLISDTELEVLLTVGTQDEHWKVHVTDPVHGNSNTLAFNVAISTRVQNKSQDQVLAQQPSSFTLQLFGSHEQKNAEAFIQQHKLGEQATYFVSERNGHPWYSVIYGVFPDQLAARAAIKTLPASLSKIKPWVRRYDDIQAGINASRQLKPQTIKRPAPAPALTPSAIFTATPPKQGDVNQYESWIWSQDPRNVTLQLMGSRDVEGVQAFLQANKNLNGRAIYFHTRHDGRDWYAVIFGVYTDKQKAREAIKRLPVALQKLSPWVRSFASIHAELSRTD